MIEFAKNIAENYPWLTWVIFVLAIVLLFGYLVENYWKDKVKTILDSSKKVNPTINLNQEQPAEEKQPEAQNAPETVAPQQQVNLAQMVQQGNVAGTQDAQQGAPVQPAAAQPSAEIPVVNQPSAEQSAVAQPEEAPQAVDPNAQGQIPPEVYQDAVQNIDPSILQVDSSIDVSSLPVYNPTDQN
jgi:hypothetical protein